MAAFWLSVRVVAVRLLLQRALALMLKGLGMNMNVITIPVLELAKKDFVGRDCMNVVRDVAGVKVGYARRRRRGEVTITMPPVQPGGRRRAG